MTILYIPQSKVIFPAFSNIFRISIIKLSAAKNPKPSMNDKQITSGNRDSISEKNPANINQK